MMINILASFMICFIMQNAMALPVMEKLLVEKYPSVANTPVASCSSCHMPAIQSGLNRFGLDYKKYAFNFSKIEGLDSDKDGISNVKELKSKLFPGSKNSTGTGIFSFKNSKGLVRFDHDKHISNKNYGAKFSCKECHQKNGFKKEFMASPDLAGLSHKLCLDCHTHKSPNSTKAAIKCSACHARGQK
ncbi:MAG: cytochrome c3 family protein [Halobacteriovoraceae bacterium]|jgi:cytochrome c553|nr:cytochrome c3 family protein [Halobacteriovoraceae bacterium]